MRPHRTLGTLAGYLAYLLLTLSLSSLLPLPTSGTSIPAWALPLIVLPLLAILSLPFFQNRAAPGPSGQSPGLFWLRTLGIGVAVLSYRLLAASQPHPAVQAIAFLALGGAAGILAEANAPILFRWLSPNTASQDLYPLLDTQRFVSQAALLLNIAGRTGGGLGLIGIRISDTGPGGPRLTPSEESFLRKQVLFLLLRNSRSHEPWTRSPDKRTCLNALVASSETSVRTAEERFRSILESHDYFPTDNTRPRPSFRSCSFFLAAEAEDPGLSAEERVRDAVARVLSGLSKEP